MATGGAEVGDQDIIEGPSRALDNDSDETFTFFFGSKSPFSQWHPSEFEVEGVTYNCAEQFMMHRKAVLFGDDVMAKRILRSDNPREQKALGRQVANFEEGKWKSACRDIVKKGNLAKNPKLCTTLLATHGTTLVEASPRDCVWGIGLSASNWKAKHRKHWRGTNWLGEILTEAREELAASDCKTCGERQHS